MIEFAAPAIVALVLLLVGTVVYYKTKISKMKTANAESIVEIKSLWFHAGFDSGQKYERDAAMIRQIIEDHKNGK